MSEKRSGLLASRWFPIVPQIVVLGFFIALVVGGWGMSSSDQKFLLTLRNTNLCNLMVWCVWWPGVVITAILFGRVWCMVCPMELMSTTLNRVGLKLKVPRFLKSGWAITLLYAVAVVIGVHTFAIHRVPHGMALYLLCLLGLTVVISLLFRRRAFCSYFCPVGHLLGLYALNSSTEWRVKDPEVCKSCKEKPCISAKRSKAWYGRACQSQLYPAKISDNRDGLLCTQCYKACDKNNVTFRWRRPLVDLFRDLKLKPAAIAFLIIVFGFAFYEVFTVCKICGGWLKALPNALNARLGVPAPWDGTLRAGLLFFVFPVLVLMLASVLQSFFSSKRIRAFAFAAYAKALIPLAGFTHFAKGVVKPVSRIQYVPGLFKDPTGVHTAKALVAKTASIGGPWQVTLNHVAEIVGIAVILFGGGVSLVVMSRIARSRKEAKPVAFWIVSILYSLAAAGALLACVLAKSG